MRYKVDSVVPFIGIAFKDSDGKEAKQIGVSLTYVPWLHEMVSMEIELLRCVEHHKVHSEEDEFGEKYFDGFIFAGEDNSRWCNQYPVASYSLSGAQDEVVHREKDPETEPEALRYFMLTAVCYLKRVSDGIARISERNGTEQEVASLRSHYSDVVHALAEKGVSVAGTGIDLVLAVGAGKFPLSRSLVVARND